MNSDKELADRVVALGVGSDWSARNVTENFVRDWRVAGALMEMMHGETLIWRQAYEDGDAVWHVEPDNAYVDGLDESLPRAIIEATVTALEAK